MVPDWLQPKTGTARLAYLAHPHRMKEMGDIFEDYVRKLGREPVNPFASERDKDGKFRKDNIEEGLVGRPAMLKLGICTQHGCGETDVLGISEGVVGEVADRLDWDSEKNIRVFYSPGPDLPAFDPMWDEEWDRWKAGPVFAALRGKNRLIGLVGGRLVGKTYAIEKAIRQFGDKLKRVRNVTTRDPRNEQDKKYYYFVTKEQFETGIKNCAFLEYDDPFGQYHGSSLEEIKRVLRSTSGIFAITPEGARALYQCRFEINISFVLLKPESDLVLKINSERRNILDPQEQKKYIEKAKDFVLPSNIPHQVLTMTSTKADKERILDLIGSLLTPHP